VAVLDEMLTQAQGARVRLPGHFPAPILIESVREFAGLLVLTVRTSSGELQEITIDPVELAAAMAEAAPSHRPLVSAEDLFLLVESARIRLAYAFDPHFAVNLTGIQVLPHQLEAVYERMLPQVMLRFLLADDPGAGKTIMAGLLLKELRLRGIVERILILCPAPLTVQWQDELASKLDESFEIMTSELARGTLGTNPWATRPRCIASIDFAKRDDVRDAVLEAGWDVVVIDEAHKCSARTDRDSVKKTERYELAQRLAHSTDRMVLLTATPHQGNADQFGHFLQLLDEDVFGGQRGRGAIQLEGNPWYLRRMKEDLRDFDGKSLFPPRFAHREEFELTGPEYELYEDVTRYINDFLPNQTGRRRTSVALARMVLQRRLASSLGAISRSLERRYTRFRDVVIELEPLSPAEREKRMADLRLIDQTVDPEQETDDEDEETLDRLAGETTAAMRFDELRAEVVELERLVAKAADTRGLGREAKLEALEECLRHSEFAELKDGRGRLLIFTEHRDTLEYLQEKLDGWGYTTTTIHGGLSPQVRRERQIAFQRDKQICIATEAAGEGINLQFCHLMINYDLPWNPNRLEQRMGRIHRIGQQYDVHVFNFVATNTAEGRVLSTLLVKLEEIKRTLGPRVYDVVGELLKVNGVNLEEMLRDVATNPQRAEEIDADIHAISAERFSEYEEAVGIALAKSQVDLARVVGEDVRSAERRLMPEYVESYFMQAAKRTGLEVDHRADGLLRCEHVPQRFRSDDLKSVSTRGRPEAQYRKFSFQKEDVRKGQNLDADLMSPGHPLFAAVD
jgi:superfamily II DNA or RNA helicase